MNDMDHRKPKGSVVCTCCMCNRIRRDGEWMEDDSVAGVVRTHTYCPVCLAETIHQNFPGHTQMMLSRCATA